MLTELANFWQKHTVKCAKQRFTAGCM